MLQQVFWWCWGWATSPCGHTRTTDERSRVCLRALSWAPRSIGFMHQAAMGGHIVRPAQPHGAGHIVMRLPTLDDLEQNGLRKGFR